MTPLLAYISPHALHRVRGPCGPRRIIGVSCALAPQLTHLHASTVSVSTATAAIRATRPSNLHPCHGPAPECMGTTAPVGRDSDALQLAVRAQQARWKGDRHGVF